MSRTLWEKINYTSRIEYVIDSTIREFDISKANISVLADAGILSEEEYQYYLRCPRMERQIAIGKLEASNPNIVKTLYDGIKLAKKKFMEDNSIDDSEVLYIRNDAIAIVGNRYIGNTQITNRVSFRESGRYSSFYRFKGIEFLYFYDPVTKKELLDIKGIKDEKMVLHKDFMIDFLCELFYTLQMEGVKNGLSLLQIVHSNYLKKELPIGYYRELNAESGYRMNQSIFTRYSSLYLEYANDFHKQYLDISYNDELFRHFTRILSRIYFDTKR